METVTASRAGDVNSETPGGPLVVQPPTGGAPAAVSHVADRYRCYPGEALTLFTRVDILQAVVGLTIQISLPSELTIGDYQATANHGGGLPELVVTGDGRYLVWRLSREATPGERFEYQMETVAPHTPEDLQLESTALVLAEADPGREAATETVEIKVAAKSSYLMYLPALYYDDELMGRFLMLFESFWSPIDKQIDALWYYFNPRMTPSEFLPWLATWGDLALDERWTEGQQRKLLESAVRLYRIRGTKQGLVDFLEIYSGRKAIITEHRANNLRLGKDSRFGPSVAVGRSNRPHSFSVYLRLPPVPARDGEEPAFRTRREQDRRRMIQSIIEAEKPAHTTYSLIIDEDN
jgi:phage tail-like protein